MQSIYFSLFPYQCPRSKYINNNRVLLRYMIMGLLVRLRMGRDQQVYHTKVGMVGVSPHSEWGWVYVMYPNNHRGGYCWATTCLALSIQRLWVKPLDENLPHSPRYASLASWLMKETRWHGRAQEWRHRSRSQEVKTHRDISQTCRKDAFLSAWCTCHVSFVIYFLFFTGTFSHREN